MSIDRIDDTIIRSGIEDIAGLAPAWPSPAKPIQKIPISLGKLCSLDHLRLFYFCLYKVCNI
jgi:hypothetical protein